ncbi:MAG: LamG domain-containing protein [Phycisphaerales bacterium]|nr:MAG: LamG domain-containing protein [Phycisphaerales bacterium]
MCGKSTYLISIVILVSIAGASAHGQPAVEQLLVELRAEDLAYGTGVTTWPNSGTLGDFTANGAPVVEDVAGVKAVTFDGSSWFEGPTSTDSIVGSSDRTIEVWAYNPEIPSEETLVSWSHRGGPTGSNIAFNYGNNGSFGAVGHWSTPDMGWWGTHSPAPAANTWWQLVYTYDGSVARVYVNGEQESVGSPVVLNTHSGNIIRVAAQADDTGAGVASQFNFTGSISLVRIYDRSLTAAQVQDLFQGVLPAWLKAEQPSPSNGALHEDTWANLSWTAGSFGISHDVYFSDNFADVNEGTAEAFQGNQAMPFLVVGFAGVPFPEGLVPGTTYYWRVDQVNDQYAESPWRGDVWSFTVPPKKAYAPLPADGAKFVSTDVTLSWTEGYGAKLHHVYFGDNPADVEAGTPDTYKGATATTTYTAGLLELGKKYYWRVDEFDALETHTGDVWSLTTIPVIDVTDPNLVGWWKFDEGQGTNALDWSGQGNHGTLVGDPEWIVGYDGDAVKLDGSDDYVVLPIGSVIGSLTSSTFTTWVNFSSAGGAWQRIFDFGTGTTVNMFLTPRTGTGGPMRFAITVGGSGAEEQATAPDTLLSGWHHVAVTIDASTRTSVLYLDGAPIANNIGGASMTPSSLGQTTSNWLGRSQYSADAYFNGSLDDFRIYNYAKSQPEIGETMRGDPLLAWDPSPADGSTPDVDTALPLAWSPGDNASQHDVYFGTDEVTVEDADATDTTGVYKGRQSGTSYSPPEGVEWGSGPYFWRIDQYNADGSISKGRVWSYTVADFLLVDDFESYDDIDPAPGEPGLNRIFDKWIDGYGTITNGAIVGNAMPPYAERIIVHSGAQSMNYAYDNAGKTSEATLTLTRRDWTEQGVTRLSLWFRGDPANAPERMFVALDGNAVVYHDDPGATQIVPWTQWVIELSAFGGLGAELTNVNTITIGFGTKNSPAAGGTGQMYFDDIRLYRP